MFHQTKQKHYLVVIHYLGLVMLSGDGIDDVEGAVGMLALLPAVQKLPLKNVGSAVRRHVRTLRTNTIFFSLKNT